LALTDPSQSSWPGSLPAIHVFPAEQQTWMPGTSQNKSGHDKAHFMRFSRGGGFIGHPSASLRTAIFLSPIVRNNGVNRQNPPLEAAR
jgi:hypothetical protein